MYSQVSTPCISGCRAYTNVYCTLGAGIREKNRIGVKKKLYSVLAYSRLTKKPRENRFKWPLLTVKTEVNEDSKSTNERVLPWLVRWDFRTGTRDFCSALAALVGSVQNIFFLARTLFQFLCPHYRPASWAGSRTGSPVSVSYVLSVSPRADLRNINS